MDAVLKHLGLRSDFIVCHPDVIDDPLFHARRPPPSPPPPPPTHNHVLSCNPLLHPPTFHRAAFSAHLLGILDISSIYMDPGVHN